MLTGKHRSSLAITAALLLTGAGVAVATGVTSPAPAPAPAASTVAAPTADPRAIALEQSVADLLAQVGPLEAAVAASDVPVAAPAPVARSAGRRVSTQAPTGSVAPSESAEDDAVVAAPAAAAPMTAPREDHEDAPEPEQDGDDD